MALSEWSSTASNNATGVTGITWAEGQAPSTVNDSARELMAQIAVWLANPTSVPTIGAFTTGDVKLTLKTTADTGWVLMNDGTIGSASSGATTRANADTVTLYTLLWSNTADADCAVSGGRGGSAAADFAANKTLALPKSLGRALAVYGTGSGLTARALAHVVGSETLSTAELPAHAHAAGSYVYTVSDAGGAAAGLLAGQVGNTGAGAVNTGLAVTGTSGSIGSSTADSKMQPSVFLNVMIKL